MNHSSDKLAILAEAIREAKLILSRHDGMHMLNCDVQALLLIEKIIERGRIRDFSRVDAIIMRMRRADKKGFYERVALTAGIYRRDVFSGFLPKISKRSPTVPTGLASRLLLRDSLGLRFHRIRRGCDSPSKLFRHGTTRIFGASKRQ